MKKRFLGILIASALLFAGCAPFQFLRNGTRPTEGAAITELSNEPDPTSPEGYLARPGNLEVSVRDYGESVSYMQMEDDFVARILYPEGSVESLDDAVDAWVQQIAAHYQAESVGSSNDGDGAELTVDYNSYVIAGGFVSVKLVGIYHHPYQAHPIDISASFNADKNTGKLLAIEDILAPEGKDILQNFVIQDAGIEPELVDENLLNGWLLTPDGIEITLARGDYLPMSEGTVTLLYSCEKLDGILSLPNSLQQEPPVEDIAQPSPESEVNNSSPAIDPTRPMLALTFDDGPSAYTERLLDAFAAHGGKATFFVVGNMLEGREDVLRRMAAEGHEIGGHSWNHRQMTKLSEDELADQLMSTRANIYNITGVDSTMVRPPYGSCNDQVKAKAGELGIALINWSVDTLDWKHKNADIVYQAVMDEAKDGAIILCHDLHKTTVEAMERAIPALIAEGYQLVTVTDLLTGAGESIEAGKLYYRR